MHSFCLWDRRVARGIGTLLCLIVLLGGGVLPAAADTVLVGTLALPLAGTQAVYLNFSQAQGFRTTATDYTIISVALDLSRTPILTGGTYAVEIWSSVSDGGTGFVPGALLLTVATANVDDLPTTHTPVGFPNLNFTLAPNTDYFVVVHTTITDPQDMVWGWGRCNLCTGWSAQTTGSAAWQALGTVTPYRVTVRATGVAVVPPAQATLSGPASAVAGISSTYTATLSPITTTLPITYTWQATGLGDVLHPSRVATTDLVDLTWASPGTQTITVTAGNAIGTVVDSYTLTVYAAPTSAGLVGPTTGRIGASLPFTVSVSPLDTSLPITYTWQADGLPIVIHGARSALDDSLAVSWPTPGTKTITVTVANTWGTTATSATLVLSEEKKVYLPLVTRTQ